MFSLSIFVPVAFLTIAIFTAMYAYGIFNAVNEVRRAPEWKIALGMLLAAFLLATSIGLALPTIKVLWVLS